jgi:transposase
MRFVGLDVHKKVVEACILNEAGIVLCRDRFACTREALEEFCREELDFEDKVAVEATTNTWGVVDIIKPFVDEVVVSNPLRTKAIAQAKVKTDKVDAFVLAQLLRCDYLPRVWEPDETTREIRSLTRRRASLVSDRTGIKNRIHAVLHQRLIHPPIDKLFSKTGLQFLRTVELDELGRLAVDSELKLIEAIDAELESLDAVLARRGYEDERVKLLVTLPGVDVTAAQTLLSALGDVNRFPSGDEAASYVGLTPSTRQSAERSYHGPITKQGRGHVRWVLVQAAQHLDKHPGPLGVFFRRLAKKKNRNVAVVATARKLVVIAWHMLRNNEPYRYALPKVTQDKLARLRVKATGQRRKGGNPKGSTRPAAYGTGQRTRRIPALGEVYESEKLSALRPPSSGEKRAIRSAGVVSFVKALVKTHRVPRRQSSERGDHGTEKL